LVWIATSDQTRFGALEAPVDVDVAVLGAGIAGLTTARCSRTLGCAWR
jgi:ribulose 1,5-bisphosphate synthetase/thiazole synthase